MNNLVQPIETIILEYLNAPALEDKADVLSFKQEIVPKVASDPSGVLTHFGSILESSVLEIVKEWKEEISAKAKSKKGKEHELNLDDCIGYIHSSIDNVNKKIVLYLDNLRAWRNYYSHGRPLHELSEQDFYTAQQCSIQMLHFLVWKYECWVSNTLDETPRSVKDKRLLLPWGAAEAVATSKALVEKAVSVNQMLDQEPVDAWGIASVKSQIHVLAEVVAQEAAEYAKLAVATYPYAAFSLLIPLICDLRWKRGYLSGLRTLLNIPEAKKSLRKFKCEDVSPPCPVTNGVLSAELIGTDRVMVKLDSYPALLVYDLPPDEVQNIMDSVNGQGRLGMPAKSGMTLRQRIEDIEVGDQGDNRDELSQALFRNREALIPLIARFGMPGSDWLLPTEKDMPKIGAGILQNLSSGKGSEESSLPEQAAKFQEFDVVEEVFLASKAFQELPEAGGISRKELEKLLHSDQVRQLFGDLVDTDPEQVLDHLGVFFQSQQNK